MLSPIGGGGKPTGVQTMTARRAAFGMGGLGFLLGWVLAVLALGILSAPSGLEGDRAAFTKAARGLAAIRADGLSSDAERRAALDAFIAADANVRASMAGDRARVGLGGLALCLGLAAGVVWVGVDVWRWRASRKAGAVADGVRA